jgi:hypothetical protein
VKVWNELRRFPTAKRFHTLSLPKKPGKAHRAQSDSKRNEQDNDYSALPQSSKQKVNSAVAAALLWRK